MNPTSDPSMPQTNGDASGGPTTTNGMTTDWVRCLFRDAHSSIEDLGRELNEDVVGDPMGTIPSADGDEVGDEDEVVETAFVCNCPGCMNSGGTCLLLRWCIVSLRIARWGLRVCKLELSG